MEQNSAKEVWNGMKRVAGCGKSASRVQWDPEFASDLNLFFIRFDTTSRKDTPALSMTTDLWHLHRMS